MDWKRRQHFANSERFFRILDSTKHGKLTQTIRVCHVNRLSFLCNVQVPAPSASIIVLSFLFNAQVNRLSLLWNVQVTRLSFLCNAQVTPPSANDKRLTCRSREMTNHTNSILRIQYSMCKFIIVCGCMCVCVCVHVCVSGESNANVTRWVVAHPDSSHTLCLMTVMTAPPPQVHKWKTTHLIMDTFNFHDTCVCVCARAHVCVHTYATPPSPYFYKTPSFCRFDSYEEAVSKNIYLFCRALLTEYTSLLSKYASLFYWDVYIWQRRLYSYDKAVLKNMYLFCTALLTEYTSLLNKYASLLDRDVYIW